MTTLLDVLNTLGAREARNYGWSDASGVTDDIAGERNTSLVETFLGEAASRGLVAKRPGSYDPEYQLTREGEMYVATESN